MPGLNKRSNDRFRPKAVIGERLDQAGDRFLMVAFSASLAFAISVTLFNSASLASVRAFISCVLSSSVGGLQSRNLGSAFQQRRWMIPSPSLFSPLWLSF